MHARAASSSPSRLATLIGSSVAITAVRELVDRLAGSDAAVLIAGPSGSGKNVVAALLHQRGGRAAQPFIAVNCAAVPRAVLESELLGEEAGAFDSAVAMRRGCFERADGGTLVLSEPGMMAADLQTKLLDILETRRVGRIGGTTSRPVNVRVVATTNADLRDAVAAERFRTDLFHGLAAVAIELPPLAARAEDIPLLIDHFVRYEVERGARVAFTPDAVAYLERQAWPGNVRELRNFVAHAAAIRRAAEIDEPAAAVLLHGERRAVDRWLGTAAAPLPMPNRRRPPPFIAAGEAVDLEALLNDFEQAYIRDAFGNAAIGVDQSARLPGLRRTTLVEKVRRVKIVHDGDPRDA